MIKRWKSFFRTNSPLSPTETDTCIACTSLSGLTAGTCGCERYATASSDGECKCTDGYIETNEGTCIHSDSLFNTLPDGTCAVGATPDRFGGCTCDSGAEMTATNQCSVCFTALTGAVGVSGDKCDPYAILKDDCECECSAGFSITTATPPTCVRNEDLYGIIDNGVCGPFAYPNEFGVCECEGRAIIVLNFK